MEEEKDVKGLRFFRFLLQGFSSKLLFPMEFVKQIKGRGRETVTLVSPNGKIWNVDCYREHDHVYIGGQSWRDLILANNFGLGYFLVFHYKGNMLFSFRAFGLNMKEISYSSVKPKQDRNKAKIINIDSNINIGQPKEPCYKKRKGERPPCTDQDQTVGALRARFEVILGASNLCIKIPIGFRNLLKGQNEVTVEDPKGRIWSIGLLSCNKSHNTYISKGWLEFSQANELREGTRCIFELVLQANNKDLIMRVDILNNINPSENPNIASPKNNAYFETIIKPYNLNRNFMRIPKGFLKTNGLTECSKLRLRDQNGVMWLTSLAQRSKCYLSKGWREFAHGNKLEVSDRCIFELVSNEEEIVLQVHILKMKKQLKLKE